MDEKYFPEKIEEKWQKSWEERGVFHVEPDDTRTPFYCLEMLPYPSGFLHMGHVRNYSIGDALSWYKRLCNYNVLHPIGWDSFGQPAEQAAIKRGVNPGKWTEENINHMRGQMKRLGISYDWRREIAAHTPEYYKWDQWFFLKMYERGLVYRRMSPVNWCPNCQTVLSNEQASGGLCWRCENPVVKKDLEQWFVRITNYAEQLLEDMKELEPQAPEGSPEETKKIETGWPERVLTMQRNWIGRSQGAYVDFAIKDTGEKVRVFTTRIDTIYGANAIVLAAEHPQLSELMKDSTLKADVDAFIEGVREARNRAVEPGADEEKEGINTGLQAINPFSGELIPVWVANYVLTEYGTGAVMAVPAHDERDFEFAQKYTLPIRQVIAPITHDIEPSGFDPKLGVDQSIEMKEAFTDYGILVNSGEWSGKLSDAAMKEMAAFAEVKGFGEMAVTYRLRDWGISRQRFWGAPVPMIHCERCGIVPVPEKDLPVLLPPDADFQATSQSPLLTVPEFVNVTCPRCGGAARRDTDTMDTFVDSSWYYYRYCDPHNMDAPFDREKVEYWMPVNWYVGGVEHAVMHLLYTRFWTKFMRDIGLISFNEPVKNLLTQGMVVAETFYREEGGAKVYFNPAEVDVVRDDKGRVTSARLIKDGQPVTVGAFEKMSKSANNGVDPDEMIRAYGADAVRMFILFAAPVDNDLRWQEAGIDGALRFLRRVYNFVWRWREAVLDAPAGEPDAASFSAEARSLRHQTHRTRARVRHDLERLHFNTCIAALMELSNAFGSFQATPESATVPDRFAAREALETMILMLTPFAPHISEEMWEGLGHEGGILSGLTHGSVWPSENEELARKEELEIPVQVNGKLRSRIRATPDATEETLRETALSDEKVRAWTDEREVVKVIVVPQRLVNIVVR
ncbi:MAG TPA: leucine--tRNA ligase [Pyrinomonadaceae bacterium]|jgi:leucyl-tRNA synthetase